MTPNLLWLARSTVRIENRGSAAVSRVALEACAETRRLGDLDPGVSIFRVLPRCGDGTIVIRTEGGEACRLYVEAGMYHIRVELAPSAPQTCEYRGTPPLTPLFLAELFR